MIWGVRSDSAYLFSIHADLSKSGLYVVYSFQSSHLPWPSLARRLQHLAVYITGHLCSHLPAGVVFSLGLWAVSFVTKDKDHQSQTLIFD